MDQQLIYSFISICVTVSVLILKQYLSSKDYNTVAKIMKQVSKEVNDNTDWIKTNSLLMKSTTNHVK